MPSIGTVGRFLSAFSRVAVRRRFRGPRRTAWPLQTEVLADFMRANMLHVATLDPPGQRAFNESLVQRTPDLKRVRREQVDAGGVPGEWFVPLQGVAADAPVVLYLHGGSYVFGSTNTHGDLIARIALASGARALGINYRLAPEHPFPAALEDALAAWRWLLAQGIAPSRIVVAGDSAGGGLAVSLLLALRDAGEPLPALGVLIAPWVDLRCDGASMTTHAPFDWGTRQMLVDWARWYIGDGRVDDPGISPVFAALGGLPPLLIHVGGAELQLDDVTRFAEKAKAAGVEVDLQAWPDMFHNFHTFHPMLKQAAAAVTGIGEAIRARTTV